MRVPLVSLYVGHLHILTNEHTLFHKFSPKGTIHSIKVYEDRKTQRSLGYTVDVSTFTKRMLSLPWTVWNGMWLMWNQQDPSLKRASLWILSSRIWISQALGDTFYILSSKVVCDTKGISRGYGYVDCTTQDAVERAKRLNGKMLADEIVSIEPFKSCKQREAEFGSRAKEFTYVYIKNFGINMDDDKLWEMVDMMSVCLMCLV